MQILFSRGIVFALLTIVVCEVSWAQTISVSENEIMRIAEAVFKNECGGNDQHLMTWNDGEDFLSVGLGHFIWYPQGEQGPFEEGFVDFLRYVKARGGAVPSWLDPSTGFVFCPWRSREDFRRAQQSDQVRQLRAFLLDTKKEQSQFLVERLNRAIPKIIEHVPQQDRKRIKYQLSQLSSQRKGLYALIDYVNFKGMGISATERYQHQGWGLLQVLQVMDDVPDRDAVAAFVRAAQHVLTQRVRNAPAQRNEQKWLAGWLNRLKTYQEY